MPSFSCFSVSSYTNGSSLLSFETRNIFALLVFRVKVYLKTDLLFTFDDNLKIQLKRCFLFQVGNRKPRSIKSMPA